VVNADIYHTVDLPQMMAAHLASKARITLAMHDYKRFNTVSVKNNLVKSFKIVPEMKQLAFMGIHIIDSELLSLIPRQIPSCIIDFYRTLLLQQEEINIFRGDQYYWRDIGSVHDYLQLNAELFCQQIPLLLGMSAYQQDEFLQMIIRENSR
jgi:mannose-1-phosphate guanylyltransferase